MKVLLIALLCTSIPINTNKELVRNRVLGAMEVQTTLEDCLQGSRSTNSNIVMSTEVIEKRIVIRKIRYYKVKEKTAGCISNGLLGLSISCDECTPDIVHVGISLE